MEEGVEEEVGIGDTNMLEIVLVELVGIFCAVMNQKFSSHCLLNLELPAKLALHQNELDIQLLLQDKLKFYLPESLLYKINNPDAEFLIHIGIVLLVIILIVLLIGTLICKT